MVKRSLDYYVDRRSYSSLKSKKCGQILHAHKPYFLMPGHKLCVNAYKNPLIMHLNYITTSLS